MEVLKEVMVVDLVMVLVAMKEMRHKMATQFD
jgi:hypothetical protein